MDFLGLPRPGGCEIEPLASPRVLLRPVVAQDETRFLELARASTVLHRPWVRVPLDPEAFAEYVARYDGERAAGFLVCLREREEIAGVVNFTEIVRGPYQRAVLGFFAFSPHAGCGHMTEGVSLAVRHAFGSMGLYRVEADVQPDNLASRALVKRLGFRREGFSPEFIELDGVRSDYERWAMTRKMMKAAPRTTNSRLPGIEEPTEPAREA